MVTEKEYQEARQVIKRYKHELEIKLAEANCLLGGVDKLDIPLEKLLPKGYPSYTKFRNAAYGNDYIDINHYRKGISVIDASLMSKSEISQWRNIGKKTISDIEIALNSVGLKMKP